MGSNAGKKLQSLLDEKNLRQSDLAKRLDVSQAYVSSVLSGKKTVSARTVEKACAALNLSEPESVSLHRAAALDQGFNLDLPEDF